MYYAGIDLGGTNIAAGIVDASGSIIKSMSIPTNAGRDFKEIVADMAELVRTLAEKADIPIKEIEAAGIGCPGSVDSERGVCEYSNNIAMNHADIRGEFQKHLNIPVYLENDANAAALGEYEINAKGSRSFVFVTLGTGVGGGVIINGEIFRGFNGVGAEFGHTVINVDGEPCTCGRKGCWEAYASVTALIRMTKEAMEKHKDSLMYELAEKEGKVSGLTSFLAAKQGDKYAQEVVTQYFRNIAEGITNLVNVFQPEKLAIGGSISKEGDYLLNPVKEFVEKNDYNRYMPKAKIEIAKLFGDAGIIGAAIAARNAMNTN